MSITLAESQVVTEIAGVLYDFLPGTPYPRADQDLSFPGVARRIGLGHLWRGGSKRPAITQLLQSTLDEHRNLFCVLVLDVVRKGIIYRSNKGNPVTREEIQSLNGLVQRVNFKVPELWDPAFLASLSSTRSQPIHQSAPAPSHGNELKTEFLAMQAIEPKPRGFAFEKFLNELFATFDLAPRGSFRLIGEQIDGSFVYGGDVYLVEAKWQAKPTAHDDLLLFREKVESKSVWSRGLFVSYSGFTHQGLEAFAKGRSTNLIGMSGEDLFFILDGQMNLTDALRRKVRHAAETGEFYISVNALIRGGAP